MNTFHVRNTVDVILLHLGKGDDMLQCLNQAITEHKIKNGAVVSMIGTLDKARYHMIQTTEDDPTNGFYTVEGPIEVAAGQGLIIDGEPHIHICMATPEASYLGHLEEGCRVLYLAEIAIEKYSEEELTRKKDNFGIAALSWKERDKTE